MEKKLFFACCYKFRKALSYFNDFWLGLVKNGHANLSNGAWNFLYLNELMNWADFWHSYNNAIIFFQFDNVNLQLLLLNTGPLTQNARKILRILFFCFTVDYNWRAKEYLFSKEDRSSHPELVCKKVFLKILQNSHDNTCAGVSHFIKLKNLLQIKRLPLKALKLIYN